MEDEKVTRNDWAQKRAAIAAKSSIVPGARPPRTRPFVKAGKSPIAALAGKTGITAFDVETAFVRDVELRRQCEAKVRRILCEYSYDGTDVDVQSVIDLDHKNFERDDHRSDAKNDEGVSRKERHEGHVSPGAPVQVTNLVLLEASDLEPGDIFYDAVRKSVPVTLEHIARGMPAAELEPSMREYVRECSKNLALNELRKIKRRMRSQGRSVTKQEADNLRFGHRSGPEQERECRAARAFTWPDVKDRAQSLLGSMIAAFSDLSFGASKRTGAARALSPLSSFIADFDEARARVRDRYGERNAMPVIDAKLMTWIALAFGFQPNVDVKTSTVGEVFDAAYDRVKHAIDRAKKKKRTKCPENGPRVVSLWVEGQSGATRDERTSSTPAAFPGA